MSRDDIYSGTRKIFALYGTFFGLVVKEVGLERALALHAQASEQQGMLTGRQLKDRLEAKANIEGLGEVLKSSNQSIGIDSSLTHCEKSAAVFSNAQCPMYDGYRSGGLDDATSEALCQIGAAAKLGTMLKIMDPNIHYRLKYYRKNPDEPCEEEIYYAEI